MENLERIQYVTRNYRVLQGLKNLPLGAWFLLGSVLTVLDPFAERWPVLNLFSLFGGLVLALVLRGFISRHYYERKLGRVLQYAPTFGGKSHSRVEWYSYAAFLFLGVLFFLAAPFLPIVIFGPVLGLVLLACWWPQRRIGWHHYAVIAAVVMMISLLSILGVLSAEQVRDLWVLRGVVFSAELGVILTIGGFWITSSWSAR